METVVNGKGMSAMQNYAKPEVVVLNETSEGVFAASGEARVCRFGRTDASAGSDICQSCSKTNGTSSTEQAFRADYQGCIENMPEKS